MPTRNINLTDHYDKFVEASIAEGRFSNASEIVPAALHLLEQQQAEDNARLEWLRGAIQEGIKGIEGGEYTTLRSPAEMERFIDEIYAEVLAESRERV